MNDSQINALAISPDKRLIAAACNPCAKIFDLTKPESSHVAYLDGHIGNITAIGFDVCFTRKLLFFVLFDSNNKLTIGGREMGIYRWRRWNRSNF